MKTEDLKLLRSDVNMLPNHTTLWPVKMVREALHQGNSCYLRLEPGDATRYEMVITPFTPDGGKYTPQALCITRMIGGAPVGTVVLYEWQAELSNYNLNEAAQELSNGNEWSKMIFVWWLDKLCNPFDK